MERRAFNEMYGRYLDVSGIVDKQLDVVYGPYERNKLDIYYPEAGDGQWPAVIFFHGGGFFKGDKRRYQLKPALYGLERGYAVVSVNYRLAPDVLLPAAFQDARTAVRFIKAHAERLGIDPNRIALWGESAGALLACFTGLVERDPFPIDPALPYADAPCNVQAVVDWYAPLDLVSVESAHRGNGFVFDGKTIHELAFGLEGDALLDMMEKVNPEKYLHDGIPPVFIEHGTGDTIVPMEVSLSFRQKLLRYLPEDQVPIRFAEGAEHGVAAFDNQENLDLIFDFLDQYVLKVKTGAPQAGASVCPTIGETPCQKRCRP